MEEIKIAAAKAHENIKLILFEIEHLRSDFENEIPKNKLGKELTDHFNELVKIFEPKIYDCAEFCFQIHECESLDDIKRIIEEVSIESYFH